MRDFVEVALLDAFAAQHFQVVENGGDDLVALGQAFVSQRDADGENAAVAIHHRIGAGIDGVRQSLLLQPVGQGIFTAVADQVTDVGIGFAAKRGAVVIDAELNPQLLARLRRHIVNDDALLLRRDGRYGDRRYAGVVIRHAAKGFCGNVSQLQQRLIAVQNAHHQVGGVIAFIETGQLVVQLAARLVFQRVEIAAGKARAWVRRVEGFRADLRHTHAVARTRHRQFCIHRVALAIGIARIEQRLRNGVGHAIDRRLQRVILHFQIEGGAIRSRAGVVAPAVLFQEFGQVFRLGITFGAHQHHMFQIVRQAQLAVRIFERPDRQCQRRQRFRRLDIGYQQHRHAVSQLDRLVLTRIVLALVDLLRQRLPSLCGPAQRRPTHSQ
ncbi:Uncharacterised protein [Acinetobacter baumannii]|nr:Uncharacterised protein [Acinetobacter baumannii]